MMQKDFTGWQWAMIGAFILAVSGMLLSFFLVVIQSPQFFIDVLHYSPQSGRGGLPENQNSTILSTPSRTPFQPLAWTSTPTITPSPTATLTPSPTVTPIPPTATETPIPSVTPLPTDTPEAPLPGEEAYISGVVGYPQNYTLDCEARSAVDLAAYFGVYIDEQEFLDRLPRSDDPEEGFVGNYWDPRGQIPPASYGVHAPPVAALLREYGLNAYDARGVSLETIKAEINAGRPVMVWVINNTLAGYPLSYTASNGNTRTVAAYEHTVIVTGYNPNYVVILDGSMTYWRTIDQFLASFGVLGNMAILVQ